MKSKTLINRSPGKIYITVKMKNNMHNLLLPGPRHHGWVNRMVRTRLSVGLYPTAVSKTNLVLASRGLTICKGRTSSSRWPQELQRRPVSHTNAYHPRFIFSHRTQCLGSQSKLEIPTGQQPFNISELHSSVVPKSKHSYCQLLITDWSEELLPD